MRVCVEPWDGPALRQVVADPWLGRRLRFTVLPVANPDAFAANLARLARGERAHQRGNAAGVDLNRNFPRIPGARSWHPFSGSAWRRSPHYAGPHALSEPEARAVVETAAGASPRLALGFHSFGELLLYPWAHTAAPNPRVADYMALGRAFRAGQGPSPWRVGPSFGFYPVIGDLDDFLDAELGTLAFTVEVGRPSARLLLSRAALNPFWWMNAPDAEGALAAVVPGVMSLLRAVELAPQADPPELPRTPREDLPGSCRAPGLPTRPLSASAPSCSDV